MAREAGVELRETLVPAKDPVGLETATAEAIRSLEGGVVGFREGDDRDVTEHAGEIGRLPLSRNDGVESVILGVSTTLPHQSSGYRWRCRRSSVG
jgi:hypothetical protein